MIDLFWTVLRSFYTEYRSAQFGKGGMRHRETSARGPFGEEQSFGKFSP